MADHLSCLSFAAFFRRFLFLNYTIPPGKKHAVEPDTPGEQNAAVFGSFSTCVLLSFLVD